MTPKQQASIDIRKDDPIHPLYINNEQQLLNNLLLETSNDIITINHENSSCRSFEM